MKRKPIHKLIRRLGPGVHDKGQSDKFILAETRKSAKGGGRQMRRRKTLSDYGKQLLEKQKIRFAYGITEKQFRGYVEEAMKTRGTDTSKKLLELLESRLDNVVYRLGLSPSRRGARQLVSHGHITVGGTKIKVPSYRVKKGDAIAVREGSKNKPVFENRKEEIAEHAIPAWAAYDLKTSAGKIKEVPTVDETVSQFDVHSVIEFYSR